MLVQKAKQKKIHRNLTLIQSNLIAEITISNVIFVYFWRSLLQNVFENQIEIKDNLKYFEIERKEFMDCEKFRKKFNAILEN